MSTMITYDIDRDMISPKTEELSINFLEEESKKKDAGWWVPTSQWECLCYTHKNNIAFHSKKCFVYTFSDDFHLHHFPNNNFEVLSCPSIKTALFEKLFHFSFRGYPNSFIYNVSFQKKPSLNLSCNTFLHDYLNKSNITDLKSKRIANWPKYYKIG